MSAGRRAPVSVADLFPRPVLPQARPRCSVCAALAEAHAEAEREFDRSAAVDVRIRMRRHQDDKHR
nr:hypothetical protein KitaXyl93_20910 [Kitasatospora sp. Xyl93]